MATNNINLNFEQFKIVRDSASLDNEYRVDFKTYPDSNDLKLVIRLVLEINNLDYNADVNIQGGGYPGDRDDDREYSHTYHLRELIKMTGMNDHYSAIDPKFVPL